jgi:hypothetical protein
MLKSSSITNISWTYSQEVDSFGFVEQGPDNLFNGCKFPDANMIWCQSLDLEPYPTQGWQIVYDLSSTSQNPNVIVNIKNVFGDTISFTHIMGIMIKCTSGTILCNGTAILYFLLPTNDVNQPQPYLILENNATMLHGNDNIQYAGVIDQDHNQLNIRNFSDTDTASCKIIIVGKV